MGRKLPWNRHEVGEAPKGRTTPAPAPAPRPKAGLGMSPTSSLPPARPPPSRQPKIERISGRARTPSTSPPPAPPGEEYMADGYDNDDKYRMVEDELVAVAGKFTAHLHAREYQRLKHLTKTRNAETINSISRPVVGRMTWGVATKHERLSRDAKRREGVKKAVANSRSKGSDVGNQDESRWTGSALHNLIESPTKASVPLGKITAYSSSGTRAAAGYLSNTSATQTRLPSSKPSFFLPPAAKPSMGTSLSQADETSDDSDDLDKVSHSRSTGRGHSSSIPVREQSNVARVSRDFTATATREHHGAQNNENEFSSRSGKRKVSEEVEQSASDDDDDDGDIFSGFLKRRQQERASRARSRPPKKTGPSFDQG